MESISKTSASPSASKKHKVELEYGVGVSMTGVEDVPVFSDKTVTVRLKEVTLYIAGRDLSIKVLDVENGRLSLSGHVTSLRYSDQVAPSSVIKRIFK